MAVGSILIIEDEIRLRNNLQILLSRAGYTVTTAGDGREGIECLRHASFDVVTSFRGIWGNCLSAVSEARRVVRAGGKVGLSFWGNQRRMEAYPLFAVLGQTSQTELDNTRTMVNIGRPGIAELLMTEAGLVPGIRTSLRLHWEFPDVELAARALVVLGRSIHTESGMVS